MFKTIIVVFAVIAAALAGVPAERQERAAVYSTYTGGYVGAPLAYSGSPLAYSAPLAYSGYPAVSAYSAYPAYTGGYYGAPAVRYY